jgi:hypothetical protein
MEVTVSVFMKKYTYWALSRETEKSKILDLCGLGLYLDTYILVPSKEVIKEQPTPRNLSATARRVLQCTRSLGLCTFTVAAPQKYFSAILAKGVGPGPTLAWPGWKQPDISVKVDTGRLEAVQFKKCCTECVLLY